MPNVYQVVRAARHETLANHEQDLQDLQDLQDFGGLLIECPVARQNGAGASETSSCEIVKIVKILLRSGTVPEPHPILNVVVDDEV